MVIGPKELKKKISEKNKPAVEQLESVIDAALEQGFDGNRVRISSGKFSNLPKMLVDKVIQKYRVQGWNVKYHDDQRDGSFYVFTEEKKSTGYNFQDQPVQSFYEK